MSELFVRLKIMKSYMIDCDTCQADPIECGDCLMSVLTDPDYGQPVRFTQQEREAFEVMAEVGLVPPLRLVAG
ncbi:MAG: hypothetical protein FWD55_05430 [Propionibacteriaceae bacterium]|nr:hypothetical protein [Propionibacteriaceae bacterium]